MAKHEVNVGVNGFNATMPIEKAIENIDHNIGFGYASVNIIRSLQNLGHEVEFCSDAPISISFAHPQNYEFYGTGYKIGYTPWESSIVPDHWWPALKSIDELWLTSPLLVEWMTEAGVDIPMHVYQHGIEPIWEPRKREIKDGVLKFLHQGEPAPRKGGDIALRAFRAAFGDKKDVHLTITAHKESALRVKDRKGSILGLPDKVYNNVSVIMDELPINGLVNLYHRHQAMIYPSYGEGFGFIPLQAMATGMPTVCTEAWAPYRHLILPNLRLSSRLADSPWSAMHPGKVFEPDFDHLVDTYRYIYHNYGTVSNQAFNRSKIAHDHYNWMNLTRDALKNVM